jgi:hypothetical protein
MRIDQIIVTEQSTVLGDVPVRRHLQIDPEARIAREIDMSRAYGLVRDGAAYIPFEQLTDGARSLVLRLSW